MSESFDSSGAALLGKGPNAKYGTLSFLRSVLNNVCAPSSYSATQGGFLVVCVVVVFFAQQAVSSS